MVEKIVPESSLEGNGSWNSLKTILESITSSDKIEDRYDDTDNLFLPSPYWDPPSPLYGPVRDILSQQS